MFIALAPRLPYKYPVVRRMSQVHVPHILQKRLLCDFVDYDALTLRIESPHRGKMSVPARLIDGLRSIL